MTEYADLDETTFKQQFIAQFLASWAANNYADACARGDQKRLHEPPVEDANFLAEKAWDHWVKIME